MLTMRIIPKMRDSPPARRKSRAPYEIPLKVWTIQNSIAGLSGAVRRLRSRERSLGVRAFKTHLLYLAAARLSIDSASLQGLAHLSVVGPCAVSRTVSLRDHVAHVGDLTQLVASATRVESAKRDETPEPSQEACITFLWRALATGTGIYRPHQGEAGREHHRYRGASNRDHAILDGSLYEIT
jgi:hypothetical protein